MGYYMRVFCTSGDVPGLRDVVDYVRDHGSPVELDPDSGPTDLDDPAWHEAGLRYKTGNLPILIEANRNDAEDSLAHEEIAEFFEFLEDVRKGKGRTRVEDHLRSTRFIVAAQLGSDMDDDGYDANGWFLQYFVERHGGMVQADADGFYVGSKRIVALE